MVSFSPEVSLLTPPVVRKLAAAAGVQPTKRLGQNFVIDANTVRRIVTAGGITPGEQVLEIGPGLGSLTLALLGAGACVTAVEIDPILAELLPQTIAGYAGPAAARFTLITADALTVSPEAITAAATPTALVANLPYNVAVPVLLRMLAELKSLTRVLIMVQAEVADRLAATPGTKAYGVPSLKAGFYGEIRREGTIGADVFWPAPNVSSGLVGINCYPQGDAPWSRDEVTRSRTFAVVDAAFAQRRKTLRKTLAGRIAAPEVIDQALESCGIDPTIRGEALSTAQFVQLAAAIAAAEGR